MSNEEIYQLLTELERSLHRLETRQDRNQLEQLLHPRFKEIGRSGKWYDRQQVIDALAGSNDFTEIQADNFNFLPIGSHSVLLTYKSAHLNKQGQLTANTRRSSLWTKSSAGWQLLFHQGTAMLEY